MCYLLSQWWIYYLMTNLSIKSIKIWERARQILLEMVIGRNHFDDCVSSKKTTLSARLSKFTVKTESFMKTFSQTQFDKTKSTFEKSN